MAGLVRGMKGAAASLAVALFLSGTPVSAQEAPQLVRSPILVVDFDQIFRLSQVGKDIQSEIDTRSRALAEESARIDAEMVAEEKAITERRETLSPEDFRALADEFDEKVQNLREEQDEKAVALNRFQTDARLRFRQTAFPVLGQLMLDAGALIVVEKRNVLVFNDGIDVSQIAAERIDAAVAAQSGTEDEGTPQEPIAPDAEPAEPDPASE